MGKQDSVGMSRAREVKETRPGVVKTLSWIAREEGKTNTPAVGLSFIEGHRNQL